MNNTCGECGAPADNEYCQRCEPNMIRLCPPPNEGSFAIDDLLKALINVHLISDCDAYDMCFKLQWRFQC